PNNYFGRYILEEIKAIPQEHIEESHNKLFPTVLIIGSNPYRTQVIEYLQSEGYQVETDGVPDGVPLIRQSVEQGATLVDLMPSDFRNQIIAELEIWVDPEEEDPEASPETTPGVP